jgi:uncharacterized SAM-dependent methyltransferase
MSSLVRLNFHASQFPENVRRDFLESLRSRQVDHKFHYDSVKQTTKWLALHQAYSPSRTDPDCATTYDRAFEQCISEIRASEVQLIGLGCGGGQKDTRLLQLLRSSGKRVCYIACDVSASMVLEARRHAMAVLPDLVCAPVVCDLNHAEDFALLLKEVTEGTRSSEASIRLFTFFGMLPNFEPQRILPRLSALVTASHFLLLSANLASGDDYEKGVRKVMPLYDNEETREWLLTFLLDLGVEREDGRIEFTIEDGSGSSGLKRIAAYFQFKRDREIRVYDEAFRFGAGEAIRLFFSYRHTPALLQSLLGQVGFQIRQQWITMSGEEGVFFVSRLR